MMRRRPHSPTSARRRSRAGLTLLEVTVWLVVAAGAAAAAGVLLVSAASAADTAAAQAETSLKIDRTVQRFSADVAGAAGTVTTDADTLPAACLDGLLLAVEAEDGDHIVYRLSGEERTILARARCPQASSGEQVLLAGVDGDAADISCSDERCTTVDLDLPGDHGELTLRAVRRLP
jgi:hypothetical protein